MSKEKEVKELPKQEKRYSISENVINGVLQYLAKQPFDQVSQLITALQQDAKEDE